MQANAKRRNFLLFTCLSTICFERILTSVFDIFSNQSMLNMEKSDESNKYNNQDNQIADMNEPSQALPGGPQKQSKSIKEQFAGTS